MAEILSRGDIINSVAAEVDMPQTKIDAIIKSFENTIARHMRSGDEVRIAGFGTFKTTERSARTSRNPRTGEPVDVPARTAPSFKAGKALKEAAMASSSTAAPAKKAPAQSAAKATDKTTGKTTAKVAKASAKDKAPSKAELSAAAKTLDKAPNKNKKK
ncbi:nucleoid DNA-binding protein [Abditibacterium utsteinense]|uniref:Nucleoid DNA-binding protein n=1 Tax=Abditibacterium utsteinense TaxID=1960156 RepID=A0A2S8SQA8_9BACT|nr:HU family DNA-binding protein [Abditibacterium utsteinense]PQV62987.1 nucleoid DNA-binding protein [Abditibacterium utsteinense]